MEKAKKTTVMVYANPIKKTGFGESAEVIEIIKDCKNLKFCKVKMISSGKVCNVFVNDNNRQ